MSPIVLAALLLIPNLDDEGTIRLVSDGTDEEPVSWLLNGIEIAETSDGKPAEIYLKAGEHELWAITEHEGPWQVLARLDPATSGVNFVPAWTAKHEPRPPPAERLPNWVLPASLAVLGAGLLLAPSSKNP